MTQPRLDLREYRYKDFTIRTWSRDTATSSWWKSYPWLFSVQKDGHPEKEFTGVPNYCESRRTAYMRGLWRAKWLDNGKWSCHYKPIVMCN